MSRERLVARVAGTVQGVGFRELVREHCCRNGIVGAVENLPDGRVQVVAEGDRATLDQLLVGIPVIIPLARVDSIESSWGVATGEFERYAVTRGEMGDELGEMTVAGVRGFASVGKRLNGLEMITKDGFADVGTRLGSIDGQLGDLRTTTKGGFADVGTRLGSIDGQLGDLRTTTKDGFANMDTRLGTLETTTENGFDRVVNAIHDASGSLVQALAPRLDRIDAGQTSAATQLRRTHEELLRLEYALGIAPVQGVPPGSAGRS